MNMYFIPSIRICFKLFEYGRDSDVDETLQS